MINSRKVDRRALGYSWSRLLLILIYLPMLVGIARADGGVVIGQRTSEPFTVTVFSAEMPLRPGLADLSVLVESTDGHEPILDGNVFIELEHESGMMIRTEATRSQARNKLLYCSLIDLPLAGHWTMRVRAKRGSNRTDVVQDLLVAPPQPVLLSYWKLIAFPLAVIVLFIMNQWLRGRRSKSSLSPRRSLGPIQRGGSA